MFGMHLTEHNISPVERSRLLKSGEARGVSAEQTAVRGRGALRAAGRAGGAPGRGR